MPPGVIFISVAVRHETNRLRHRNILIFLESLSVAVEMRKTNLGRGYTNMSEILRSIVAACKKNSKNRSLLFKFLLKTFELFEKENKHCYLFIVVALRRCCFQSSLAKG